MSVNLVWDWSLASADGLLTNEECSMLLDVDLLDDKDDLLKSFPSAAPKIAAGLQEFQLCDDDGSSTLYPPSPPETKPSRSQLADDLLQQLDNQHKQENIFSNWLEEKSELPIFENIPSDRVDTVPVAAQYPVVPPPPQPQATEELLREFETVYGTVELTHLTPPQSPPGPATQLLLSYAHLAQPPAAVAPPAVPLAPWLAPDYERELQAVEELVRGAASPPAPSSSSSSPASSPRSSSTDEEWSLPASTQRGKPYERHSNAPDRRSRKKEQNKNAATRYRQKKKAEVEVLLSEESTLRLHHTELGNKCADLQREIRYLKGLMRDLFKAKGLIK